MEKPREKLLPKTQYPCMIPGYTPAWGLRQAHWQFAWSNISRAQSQRGSLSHVQNPGSNSSLADNSKQHRQKSSWLNSLSNVKGVQPVQTYADVFGC